MYVNFTVLSLVLFLGICQALFLAAVYFRSGEPGPSHRLLAGLLVILALSTGNGFFYQTELYEDLGWLIGLPLMFQFLVGPVFWLYVKSLTEPGFRLRPLDALHLVPAATYLLFALPFLSAGSLYKMVLMYSWLHQERPVGEYLSSFWYEFGLPLQTGVYLVLVWVRLLAHERHIRDQFSTVDGLTLRWLRRVVAVFGLGLLGVSLGYGLILAGVQLNGALLCVPLANTAAVYYFSWVSNRRGSADPWSVRGARYVTAPVPTAETVTRALRIKYEKSSLPDLYLSKILRRLEIAMRAEKPYLDPDLTLDGLAQAIRASRNHLSQALNQNLRTTFYEYVNRFRIKEAAERLILPGGPDILTVAEDCGFRSKSTFNKVFKAWYGVSPSDYRRGLRCPPLNGVEGDKGII
jgi:AraC-like DNA-binding protein